MITSISIENFKGIAGAVSVPIRPITLLFGKNSAGKSTILQAMHYAREILQHRNPDPDKTVIGGDSIDLGGFANLVNGHDKNKRIRLSFEVALDEFGLAPFPFARDYTEHVYGLDEEGDALAAVRSVTIEMETTWKDGAAHIASYAVGLNGQPMVKVEIIGTSATITEFNDEHPIFNADQPEEDEDAPGTLARLALEHWGDHAGTGGIEIEGLRSCVPGLDGPLLVASVPPLSSASSESSSEEEADHTTLFWIFMSRVLVRAGQALLSQLERMRYVGPIRSVPPRGYRPPLTPDESRWACGLGAWDAMLRSEEMTKRTSRYLQDVLKLGYSIRRENRIPVGADGEIMAELRLLAARYDERDAEYLRKRVLDPLDRLPRQPVLQIHDEMNHIDVDPADIGVGVSQVIPVVVGALASKTESGSCRIFSVEQPELHVHPAVQVALGDVFIDAIRSADRTMLIETHSEHLLLRLLRRVRESADVKPRLQEGDGYGDGEGYGDGAGGGTGDGSGHLRVASPKALTADELSVVYVKPTSNGLELTPLPVTKDGDFTEPWPEGFFDQRDSELF